jgi:hypothetical protein
VADGPVDSAIGVTLDIPAGGKKMSTTGLWQGSAAGCADHEQRFLQRKPEFWLEETARALPGMDQARYPEFQGPYPREITSYKNSLFTIKSQLDRKGLWWRARMRTISW